MIKVTMRGSKILVNIDHLNIEAEFESFDDATEFIQSVILKITRY